MKCVVSGIDDDKKDSEIIQDVNIVKAIHRLQVASKDVSTDTIVHSFPKWL